jgi:acyl-CoA dehydrogenase family member 9
LLQQGTTMSATEKPDPMNPSTSSTDSSTDRPESDRPESDRPESDRPESDRERQMREAEELLGTEETHSFAKGLFFGRFQGDLAWPYPTASPEERPKLENYLQKVRAFLRDEVDSDQIDRESRIPDEVMRRLFDLGIMSMSIPEVYGGLGFSQYAYCKVIEEIGAEDASIGVLVNAHQSIGLKSLLLFGTPEQQERWLPRLVNGELAAFALTEEQAGSDAGGVETRAIPTEDGTHYILNGRKQWITNGGIAGLLTVMAKVPGTRDEKGRERITAFLVTPDMPGFEVEAAALDKCGIRGTATAKLAFHNVRVPVENIVGPPGKGLRVALTLLDYGRTTFGATCTGAAKRCVRDAIAHARTRHQFGKPLGHFELVKEKIARMTALAFAMESGTYLTAGLIDRGLEDYMVETAMLKVYASDALWEIINDTIQIFGGRAYFKDQPYERMMRDARINQIGEGANDVLRTFIALVGLRDYKQLQDAIKSPLQGAGKLMEFGRRLPGQARVNVPVAHADLSDLGRLLEDTIRTFGKSAFSHAARYRAAVIDRQYIQARLADAATELYMMSAVVARLDSAEEYVGRPPEDRERDVRIGRYYCRLASRRIRNRLAELGDNLDDETTALADRLLRP